MSERKKHDTTKNKKGLRDVLVRLLPIFVIVLIAGGISWEHCGARVYGTTPAQIEALTLEGKPRQVAQGLSSTEVTSTTVRARFKSSAGKPYEYFSLSWDADGVNVPTHLTLVPERATKEEADERGAQVVAALARRFHGHQGAGWQWGAVEIFASKRDGELSARVDVHEGEMGPFNARLERQLDAARQVLLEIAFGIPVRANEAELAELLGTGYKTADVGRIDPETPFENIDALIAARFPGSVRETSQSWMIAVDHPLLTSVTFDWDARRGGHMSNVFLRVDDAFDARRDSLESCLANVIALPRLEVPEYAPGKKESVFRVGPLLLAVGQHELRLQSTSGNWDGASLAKTFDALAGCRDKMENTGARGDGRKN